MVQRWFKRGCENIIPHGLDATALLHPKVMTHVAQWRICSHLVEYEIGFITFLGFSDGMFLVSIEPW